LIPFADTLLLCSLVGQPHINLAPPRRLSFVGGLLVTFAALRLAPAQRLAATLLTACDRCAEPVPFGTHSVSSA